MKDDTGPKLSVVTKKHTAPGTFDPMTVAQTLTEDVLLLESADTVTKLGEKSLVYLDLSLKVEAKNNLVCITALFDEARPLILKLREQFVGSVVMASEDTVSIAIDPLYHHLDLLQKMRSRSALDVIRAVLSFIELQDNSQKKNLMLAGSFSYDFLDHFEKLPEAKTDVYGLPDFLFYLPLTLIVIDHKRKKTSAYAHALLGDINRAEDRLKKAWALVENGKKLSSWSEEAFCRDAIPYSVDIPDQDFYRLVEQCKEHIKAGDVYQIVPSRTFSMPIKDPILSYRVLRQSNPSPYMFYMRNSDWCLFGASPETFIKVDKNGKRVSIRPIAGTRRRGFDADGDIDNELDAREQASLCLDEKELAEHMMLVDLARNDIASVSRPNTRRIKRLLGVDRFSHVMHLVSEVEGQLLKGFDALSAYQASMNMGTLMGAPKVRAAELLRGLERTKRGFYGGAVGYIDFLGNMDTAIIIRSALVKGHTAYVRAGCGVVSDSVPHYEVEETINKAEAVLRAIARGGSL